MKSIIRKFRQLGRCRTIGDGWASQMRLAAYQIKGAYGSQPGGPGGGLISFKLRHAENGSRAVCYLRKSKSDWIIFREIFYFDDYARVAALGFTPRVIYDIGANSGLAAVYLHLRYPGARIFGFEPGTPEFVCASRNYSANQFGTVFPIGVGDSNAELPYLANETESGGQGFSIGDLTNATPGTMVEGREVRRLDDFAGEQPLPPPDLIKMDIEGFELKALEGMPGLLKKCRGVLMETHGPELHAGVLRILSASGFTIIADELRFGDYRILTAERGPINK